eukprot:gene17723-21133_t
MIEHANKEGLSRVCSAFGVLGLIRFLHGYYIILITKRRKVGVIGTHIIYGIDDTTYVYIPTTVPKTTGPDFTDETRYKGLFLGLDLTKDFFFSYTYDITRTLQFNMTRYFHTPSPRTIQRDAETNRAKLYYNEQFAWNQFLLEHLVDQCQTWFWILPIIHGFFVQEKIDIFGKSIDLILVARRSRHYAGARFLKRGINEDGHVANDVETEQIVQEPLCGNTMQAQFSSYVQVRGSIPLYWEQDNNIMTPKPPIQMQRVDPFYTSTIMHFQHLFRKYGSPIVILNLVKSNEKKPRESILRNEFTTCIETLNEQLPPEHQIVYRAWDFHQAAKSKNEDHMGWLDSFASATIQKTGIFHSSKKLYSTTLSEAVKGAGSRFNYGESGTEQMGIARTNCIDSLDRTNSAQFCIGKCALGHQLQAIGVIDTPSIDFNTGVVEVLIEMYEACGNQIALQYGGSELANTIKTYTKNSLSSQSRDLVTTIKRYISNSFIDVDKQHSINLFLGCFVPTRTLEDIPLWALETDHYLHNKTTRKQHILLANTNWWDKPIRDFKKTSLMANINEKRSMIALMKSRANEFEDNFYKADTFSSIDKHFSHRFNDPIRFRNSSPLATIASESPSPMSKKKATSSGDPTNPNNPESNGANENRYDIKRWVFSITHRNKEKGQTIKPTDEVKREILSDDEDFDSYQPFKEFGIKLGTKKSEQEVYANYVQPMEKNINIHQTKYSSQDVYNNTYYRDYLRTSYQVTDVVKPVSPALVSSPSSSNIPLTVIQSPPTTTQPEKRPSKALTKQDLKNYYYNAYLQQHAHKQLYSVHIDNVSVYREYTTRIKSMVQKGSATNNTTSPTTIILTNK